MKKILFIYLTIVMAFIVSCNNKTLNPTNNSDGITYYDPDNAEMAKFNIAILHDDPNNPEIVNNTEFKKIAESSHAIVYIQSSQTFDMNNVKSFFNKFEENYDEEVRIYGEPVSLPNVNNDKVVFLIYNFYPESSNGAMGGFFNMSDLYDNKKDPVINEGKYMYINTQSITEDPDIVAGTMLHEFQHLINASVNRVNNKHTMDLWLNESLSESTSILFAPAIADARLTSLSAIPYLSFYSWNINEIFGDIINPIFSLPTMNISYSTSSLFMRWILDKGGREVIRDIAHSDSSLNTRDRLVNSVKHLGIGNNMEELLVNCMKDMYNQNLIHAIRLSSDSSYIIPGKGLPLVPGAFIIYDANRYNLNNTTGIKEEVLDAADNIHLVWNPNFESVDVDGTIDPNAVIWIQPTENYTTAIN